MPLTKDEILATLEREREAVPLGTRKEASQELTAGAETRNKILFLVCPLCFLCCLL